MKRENGQLTVVYSFPHKLGAGRICYTAWQQVNGLAAAGAKVLVFPGVLSRSVPEGLGSTLRWRAASCGSHTRCSADVPTLFTIGSWHGGWQS